MVFLYIVVRDLKKWNALTEGEEFVSCLKLRNLKFEIELLSLAGLSGQTTDCPLNNFISSWLVKQRLLPRILDCKHNKYRSVDRSQNNHFTAYAFQNVF